ncbi:hypothetical protein DFR85_14510 [Acidianus brierleyi]|uniref:MFS transporter n=2 Tax=Acidianus brierleyi TaxID=41673 RepID=A0A2U9IHY9_9CREN|nr:hypothetical protein DFR85_14510 [Acidianus brierleyi]
MVFRSIFSLFTGFMSFSFIALMKIYGLNSFQVGLVLTLIMITQSISYIVLIIFSIGRNIVVSAIMEVLIGLSLLFFKNVYSFLSAAILMGVSNAIFSSVIILQKDFVRKDYSILMTLTSLLNILGIGLFYLRSFINFDIILFAVILALISNVIISLKIKYEEPKGTLRELFRLKSIWIIFPLKFFAAMRRVLVVSYIPLILLSVFSTYPPGKISLYLAFFQIPLILFLYIGHKISNKVYIIMTIMEFFLFLLLSVFYNISIFVFLSIILLANATAYLRAPAVEETVVKLLRFNTKLSAFSHLTDMVFLTLSSILFSLLIKFHLYYVMFVLAGLASFLQSIMIFRIMANHSK